MGDAKGFLRFDRVGLDRAPAAERIEHFDEFEREVDPQTRQQQAARCIDCGVPFCTQGCPLGNPIPDFNEAIHQGRWDEAWALLSETNPLPEVTGRLCPAPCEKACTLALAKAPITIEHNERAIAERAFAEGWVRPPLPKVETDRHIAIVGSGPAGLAAAQQLRKAGHQVTVYERAPQPGGLLRYGIPNFKLEKHILDRRLDLYRMAGIRFKCGVEIGTSPSWSDLVSQHDAVLIAIGSEAPRALAVEGSDLPGVVQAMDLLRRQNLLQEGADDPAPHLDAAGKRVIILGGGDTGADCLGTVLRQGAAHVEQIELFPQPPSRRPANNPWPAWPLVFRTGTSHEEGGTRSWGWRTTHLSSTVDGLTLHAEPVDLVDGRLERVPGTSRTLDADLVVLAMGFVHPVAAALEAQLGVALDGRGNVVARQGRTTVPALYVAGDAHRGASLVVWALAEGMEVARAIDEDLMGDSPLPRIGQDAGL